MEISKDVEVRIRTDFAKGEADPILELLSELKPHMEPARVLRCIVFLADGNFEKLAAAVELALVDARDLIVSAEYAGWESKRVRNLSLPFPTISDSTDQHTALAAKIFNPTSQP